MENISTDEGSQEATSSGYFLTSYHTMSGRSPRAAGQSPDHEVACFQQDRLPSLQINKLTTPPMLYKHLS